MGEVNSGTQPARPRRTVRKVLLVVLGIVVLGAVGTAGAAFIAYDEATKIDRRYPRAVVGNYVAALLVKDDATLASLHECRQNTNLGQIRDVAAEIRKQKEEGVATEVVIGAMSQGADGSQVTADLEFVRTSSTGVSRSSRERWEFVLADEDGWRVCSATKLVEPSSSPSTQPTLQ